MPRTRRWQKSTSVERPSATRDLHSRNKLKMRWRMTTSEIERILCTSFTTAWKLTVLSRQASATVSNVRSGSHGRWTL